MSKVTKKSTIRVDVGLDETQLPISLHWSASDMHSGVAMEECKAMMLALFDKEKRETLRIDLWTKEMQVQEMDRFVFQILRSLSQTYLNATQNKELAEDLARFSQYFGEKTEIIKKS